MIVAVLLAAGSASRFGSDKLMHPLPDGTPIAVLAARHLKASFQDSRSIAVVKPGATALSDALRAEGFDVVVCDRASDGMGNSLATAIGASEPAEGYVVALGDMPFIDVATIASIKRAVADGASIAAPQYRGARGHPVGFAGRHRDELAALTRDEGARALVARLRSTTTLIDVDDPGILQDIDTPAALEASLKTYLR